MREIARAGGLKIPVIWNSSGYEKAGVIAALRGTVDIYMPDCKYYSDELAEKFSSAPDYFYYASKAISEMAKQTGRPVCDGGGMLRRGTIVRILALPGHTDDTMKIIHYLYREFRDDVILSIMGQYTPPAYIGFPELRRPLTQDEYDEVVDFAAEIGVKNAYIQELGSIGESFIPGFGEPQNNL
jgi:putative pyruvate formate lyase activating enzyme